MYEISRKDVLIDDKHVPVYTRDVCNHNILTVTAGALSTGNDKWDTKTYIEFINNGGTNWNIETLTGGSDGVRITLRGDAELDTMIEALEFSLEALRDARAGRNY